MTASLASRVLTGLAVAAVALLLLPAAGSSAPRLPFQTGTYKGKTKQGFAISLKVGRKGVTELKTRLRVRCDDDRRRVVDVRVRRQDWYRRRGTRPGKVFSARNARTGHPDRVGYVNGGYDSRFVFSGSIDLSVFFLENGRETSFADGDVECEDNATTWRATTKKPRRGQVRAAATR